MFGGYFVSTPQKCVAKFIAKFIAICAAFIAAVVIIYIFIGNTGLAIMLTLAALFVSRLAYLKAFNSDIVFGDDPLDMKSRLERFDRLKLLKPRVQLLATTALGAGDYRRMTDVCFSRIKKVKVKSAEKVRLLVTLMFSAFARGDDEYLQQLLTTYLNLISTDVKLQNISSVHRFYRHYLNGTDDDLDQCIAFAKNAIEEIGVQTKNPFCAEALVLLRFMLAVAYYKRGKLDLAKSTFEQLCKAAPKMELAAISEQYLEAIASGTEVELDRTHCTFDPKGGRRAFRLVIAQTVRRVLFYVLIAATFALFLWRGLFGAPFNTNRRKFYESSITRYSEKYKYACGVSIVDGNYTDSIIVYGDDSSLKADVVTCNPNTGRYRMKKAAALNEGDKAEFVCPNHYHTVNLTLSTAPVYTENSQIIQLDNRILYLKWGV